MVLKSGGSGTLVKKSQSSDLNRSMSVEKLLSPSVYGGGSIRV